ncbi:MAG TPA: glycosyltransferase family 4 protein [Steroidobacter sp.]|uniref:glycosyltransferase family 4 protein n=1 Tax=Steroidobacter sp. TaxID=1978227 RepID=UPI002EDBA421
MKVLMTADAVGGVWSYAMTLCASLQSHGVDVTLATLGPRPTAEQARTAAALNNVRLFESDYRLEWMPEGWKDQDAAGQWLLQLADAEAADVVHVNGYSLAALRWRRPTVCVAHSCVSSWWRAVHGVAPSIKWQAYRCGVVAGLNSADQVVAPTQAFLAELKGCYQGGWQGSWSARVIYNGMASDNDAADTGRRRPIVFACGRPWDAAKNMGVLDEAARELPWPVYLAGDLRGPDGSRFASSSLRALGSLPGNEVVSWLRQGSIFVHPALYEPFGLAVAEAAASGCALVLADIPTLRELWDGAAEFFDPRDARELSVAVNALIADPMRRRELGIAARQRAAGYSARAMAGRYCELYKTLIGASQRRLEDGGERFGMAPSSSRSTQAQAVRV